MDEVHSIVFLKLEKNECRLQNENYISILNLSKTVLFLAVTMLWLSCSTCDDAAYYYVKDSFNMILKSKPSSGRGYTLKGINPATSKSEKYYDDGGFFGLLFKDLIENGDTLVKQQSELKVYIHKKDTIIVFPFKCGGKVYE